MKRDRVRRGARKRPRLLLKGALQEEEESRDASVNIAGRKGRRASSEEEEEGWTEAGCSCAVVAKP